MKALLENVANIKDQHVISFKHLYYSFNRMYWKLVVHHLLLQSNSHKQISAVQKVILAFQQLNNIPSEWNYNQFPLEQQLQLIKQVKKQGKRYVIDALYSDFNEEVYSFDIKKEYIQLNSKYYNFF